MTEPLTDAELDTLCEDSMGWPEIPRIVAELRELREQQRQRDLTLSDALDALAPAVPQAEERGAE